MKVGSLFSGYGGLDLAVEAHFGAETVWHCELDPHASKVLAAHWGTPNLGDITAVNWDQVEPVDILCGGFPCQDISSAGLGAGIKEGTRSGLWYRYADAVRVLRPRVVVVENVSALLVRGLDIVLGDLADIGYDARWCSVRASDVGAPHRRQRVFLVAHPVAVGVGVGCEGAVAEPLGHHSGGHPRPAAHARRERHGGGQDGGVVGLLDREDAGLARQRERARQVAGDRSGEAPTDAEEPERRGPQLASVGAATQPAAEPGEHPGEAAWGDYAPAVARWAAVIGRPAPAPTDDRGRLSPLLVEWMMGLPEGWVCDHLDRRPALRALGNGVVPQQARLALQMLEAS